MNGSTTSNYKHGPGFANLIVSSLVRCMFAVPALESLLIKMFRFFQKVQPAKAVWWRLPVEFKRQASFAGCRPLRWVLMPSINTRLLVDVNSLFGCLYFERESYESPTTDFLVSNIHPGDVFADIGANVGYYTILAAALAGPAGRVFAFEPNPEERVLLGKSVLQNEFSDRIDLIPSALSDVDRQSAKLYLSTDPSASVISSLAPWNGHLISGAVSRDRVIEVELRTFDSIVEEFDIKKLDCVKLDVEGSELNVLKGMEHSLRRFRPRYIVCETALGGDVDKYLVAMGYAGKPLEYFSQAELWGNILYTPIRLS